MRQLPSVSLTHTFSLHSLKLSKTSNQVCHKECIQISIEIAIECNFTHIYCMANRFSTAITKRTSDKLSYDSFKALDSHQLINQPINQVKLSKSYICFFFFYHPLCQFRAAKTPHVPFHSKPLSLIVQQQAKHT